MRIELKNIRKAFGDLVIYEDLNLTIEPDEITVILGRSGQGKSVMLKHIVGLLQPDAGEILVDGQNIVGLSEKKLYPIRIRIGMIFQGGGLLQSLTVGENVALPMIELKGANRRETMDKVREKLEMVGLPGKENQLVGTLSGGQQKRVAIARALLQDADCLLFDEPTAGLDPPISQTVDDIIKEVSEKTRCTIVIVTHDLTTAFGIGDRIHLMHAGSIAASGTPEEFRKLDNPVVKEFISRGATV